MGTPDSTGLITVRPAALQRILPPSVIGAELRAAESNAPVHPDEKPFVANAGPGRRREFGSARACARRALAELGIGPVAIIPGHRREPQWPPGVVGSLAHCPGYRCAAVAWRAEIAGLGIDVEPNEALPEGVLDLVSTWGERGLLRELVEHDPQVCWDRLLFTVKESVYKAWFPVARHWLGFLDVEVHIEPAAASFTIRLPGGRPGEVRGWTTRLSGGWTVDGGFLIAASVMHHED